MSAERRITVGLIRAADNALLELTERLGFTKSDVVNRAIQVYLLIETERANGKDLLLRDADGNVEKVRFL